MFIDVTASQSKAFVIRGPVTEPRDILGFAPSAGVDDLAENFVINGNGHVSIGTNDMKTSLLAVGGEVACRGVRILDPALNMPDYVFSPNYVLPRLDSVQTFIDQNCHLPGVESAQMIMENGLDMAKMQAAQLEQIERLYLYILSLEKKLKELDKKLDEIEKNDEK